MAGGNLVAKDRFCDREAGDSTAFNRDGFVFGRVEIGLFQTEVRCGRQFVEVGQSTRVGGGAVKEEAPVVLAPDARDTPLLDFFGRETRKGFRFARALAGAKVKDRASGAKRVSAKTNRRS